MVRGNPRIPSIVRSGSVKRVAAAVGEGAQVVAALYAYLATAERNSAVSRAELATSPAFNGSFSLPKMIGIVVVAFLAASAATVPAGVAMTLARRRTNSAANAGNRSN